MALDVASGDVQVKESAAVLALQLEDQILILDGVVVTFITRGHYHLARPGGSEQNAVHEGNKP